MSFGIKSHVFFISAIIPSGRSTCTGGGPETRLLHQGPDRVVLGFHTHSDLHLGRQSRPLFTAGCVEVEPPGQDDSLQVIVCNNVQIRKIKDF